MKSAVRKEIAANAARIRWDKTKSFERALEFDWANEPLDAVRSRIETLLKVYQTGCRFLQQRARPEMNGAEKCFQCPKTIAAGKWVASITVKDSTTEQFKNIYFCSSTCHEVYQREKRGGVPR